MINIETGLYALDRIDEAAAELKAKAQGLMVTRAGWEIFDGDKRFATADVAGSDLSKVVAHAKSQIAAAKDPRLCGATAQLSDGAKIRFLLAAWDQLADCAATVEGSEQIREHGFDAVRAASTVLRAEDDSVAGGATAQLRVGDVVVLKGSSAPLTVERMNGDGEISVVWFADGMLRRDRVAAAALLGIGDAIPR